jgi:hypothetical protein
MSEESIRVELNGMRGWLERIDDKLEMLSTRVLSTPICPTPGACVNLQRDTVDHEKRLRQLEDSFSQARGLGTAARLIWGAVGGAVGAGLVWLAKHV